MKAVLLNLVILTTWVDGQFKWEMLPIMHIIVLVFSKFINHITLAIVLIHESHRETNRTKNCSKLNSFLVVTKSFVFHV